MGGRSDNAGMLSRCFVGVAAATVSVKYFGVVINAKAMKVQVFTPVQSVQSLIVDIISVNIFKFWKLDHGSSINVRPCTYNFRYVETWCHECSCIFREGDFNGSGAPES